MSVMQTGEAPKESREDISARFTANVNPQSDQLESSAFVRDSIRGLALYLNSRITDSREKSLAITHLEEALMWSNKAIMK